MKIITKITLSNIFYVALIGAVYFFVHQNLDLLLARLHFLEVADEVNISLLDMRLSEKNFFLYADKLALTNIKSDIDKIDRTVQSAKISMIQVVGKDRLEQFGLYLKNYEKLINNLKEPDAKRAAKQAQVRKEGKKLREFSSKLTKLERIKTNRVVSGSKIKVFYFFCGILILNILVSFLAFSNILKSLKQIGGMAKRISEGDFSKVETRSIPKDELGSVMRAINSMADELEKREDQIIQSKKLASLGVLTAGVAHELGNPLNNISMIAQTYLELSDELDKKDSIEYMRKVEEQTRRIKQIVQNLLDFSKPKKKDFHKLNINDVIKKSLRLTYNVLHVSGVEAKLDLQDQLPYVLADEDKIQSVFVNLITNAVQAMSPGGVLSFRTYYQENENHLVIECKDTGHGIPPEIVDHIFDPFFSTKGVHGTGLGLSVSYGIIKNHRGKMRVKSEVGVGTVFIIELPILEEVRDEKA